MAYPQTEEGLWSTLHVDRVTFNPATGQLLVSVNTPGPVLIVVEHGDEDVSPLD